MESLYQNAHCISRELQNAIIASEYTIEIQELLHENMKLLILTADLDNSKHFSYYGNVEIRRSL